MSQVRETEVPEAVLARDQTHKDDQAFEDLHVVLWAVLDLRNLQKVKQVPQQLVRHRKLSVQLSSLVLQRVLASLEQLLQALNWKLQEDPQLT